MRNERKKNIKETLVTCIIVVVAVSFYAFLYFLSRDDSAGTYKYCTLEHVDVHDRGGLVSGNTDYKRVADFKTKECGNLHMSDSPDPKKSMDEYAGSLEVGGYYKVTLLDFQVFNSGSTSVTRFEKADRPL